MSETSESTPEQEEQDELNRKISLVFYAGELLKDGLSRSEIESKLMTEKGLNKQEADEILEGLAAFFRGVSRASTEDVNKAANKAAWRDMIIGGLVFAVGGYGTLATYLEPSAGGTYTIAWGAMAVGAIWFFRGLSNYSR